MKDANMWGLIMLIAIIAGHVNLVVQTYLLSKSKPDHVSSSDIYLSLITFGDLLGNHDKGFRDRLIKFRIINACVAFSLLLLCFIVAGVQRTYPLR